MFQDKMVDWWQTLSNIASSDNVEDGEDDDNEETDLGKRSKDNEPGWVMGILSRMVELYMDRFRQIQMMLDTLTHPR